MQDDLSSRSIYGKNTQTLKPSSVVSSDPLDAKGMSSLRAESASAGYSRSLGSNISSGLGELEDEVNAQLREDGAENYDPKLLKKLVNLK
jgi:hypothetical protein